MFNTKSDVTLFLYSLVRGLQPYQYVIDSSSANGSNILILGPVTVTAKLQGKDSKFDGLVTDHVGEVMLNSTGWRRRKQIAVSKQEK